MLNTSVAPLRGMGEYRYTFLLWVYFALKIYGKPLTFKILCGAPGYTKSDFYKLKSVGIIVRKTINGASGYVLSDRIKKMFDEEITPMEIPIDGYAGYTITEELMRKLDLFGEEKRGKMEFEDKCLTTTTAISNEEVSDNHKSDKKMKRLFFSMVTRIPGVTCVIFPCKYPLNRESFKRFTDWLWFDFSPNTA